MKVRAKDSRGKWIFGIAPTPDKTQLLMPDDSFTRVDPNTVCEFSNCFDRNGTEIYAGDILKADDEFLLVYNCCGRFLTGIPKLVDVYQLYIDDLDNARNVKIVGNIFDNPDFFDLLPLEEE